LIFVIKYSSLKLQIYRVTINH